MRRLGSSAEGFSIGTAQSKKTNAGQREAKVRHERRLEHTEEQLGHPGEKFAKARIWSKTLCVDVAKLPEPSSRQAAPSRAHVCLAVPEREGAAVFFFPALEQRRIFHDSA